MRVLLLLSSVMLVSCSSSGPGDGDSASKAYLEKAAAMPGATRTASGLVYRELTLGTGASPKPTDVVKIHYRGTLMDGTEFDSSYKRNEPAQFPLNRANPYQTEVQK